MRRSILVAGVFAFCFSLGNAAVAFLSGDDCLGCLASFSESPPTMSCTEKQCSGECKVAHATSLLPYEPDESCTCYCDVGLAKCELLVEREGTQFTYSCIGSCYQNGDCEGSSCTVTVGGGSGKCECL